MGLSLENDSLLEDIPLQSSDVPPSGVWMGLSLKRVSRGSYYTQSIYRLALDGPVLFDKLDTLLHPLRLR